MATAKTQIMVFFQMQKIKIKILLWKAMKTAQLTDNDDDSK